MYRQKANRHLAVIGNKELWVDSNLEERVLRWLETNGFSGRWDRTKHGYQHERLRYTPDLELLVQWEEKLHRALVEIKPTRRNFTKDISRRMLGIAPHFGTKLFLLYTDRPQCWYRIDIKTGKLHKLEQLVPGHKLIKDIPRPIAIHGDRVYSHHYRKRPRLILKILQFILETIEGLIKGSKR